MQNEHSLRLNRHFIQLIFFLTLSLFYTVSSTNAKSFTLQYDNSAMHFFSNFAYAPAIGSHINDVLLSDNKSGLLYSFNPTSNIYQTLTKSKKEIVNIISGPNGPIYITTSYCIDTPDCKYNILAYQIEKVLDNGNTKTIINNSAIMKAAVGPDGYLYLNNGKGISVYDSNDNIIKKSNNIGPISELALDNIGNIYTAILSDDDNYILTIKKYDSNFTLIKQWQIQLGNNNITLGSINDMAIGANSKLYVSVREGASDDNIGFIISNKLYVTDTDGNFLFNINTPEGEDIATTSDGTLYFLSDMRMLAYNDSGELIKEYYNSGATGIQNFDISNDEKLLYGIGIDMLTAFNINASGSIEWEYGHFGSSEDSLNLSDIDYADRGGPITTSNDDLIYIGDLNNKRIVVVNKKGEREAIWPTVDENGNPLEAKDIAVYDKSVYVLSTNGGIYRFSNDGMYQGKIKQNKDYSSMTIDNKGYIYAVIDFKKISKIRQDGRRVNHKKTGSKTIGDIRLNRKNGKVYYVTESDKSKLIVLNKKLKTTVKRRVSPNSVYYGNKVYDIDASREMGRVNILKTKG